MRKTLTIGFDVSRAEADAIAEAGEEFAEAAEREGFKVGGGVVVTVIRDDPERTALGEYSVRIEGEWVDGDQ